MNQSDGLSIHSGRWAVKLASRLRFLFHPISLFVGLQILSVTTIVLWVVWFTKQEDRIKQLVGSRQWASIEGGTTVVILVVGCILLGGILVLTVVWFLNGLRQSAIIKQQRNFLSSVTHEVRSPLASIQLALETLGSRVLEPQIRDRLLAGAHQDIARMTRLVDQILIAARLDRGITLFAEGPETIDLSEWLPALVADITSHALKLGNIETPGQPQVLVEVTPGTLLWVPSETLRIVVENLIQNALKYSPANAVVLVRAAHQDNGSKILISVIDQGMGLDPKEIKLVFRIFRRGKRAVKKAIPGTGLGLYIVDSMTRIMGGRVRAESPGINQGSTFTIELPSAAGRKT